MPANYAYLVQMDIPAEHEADFNRVYDTEHAKYICNAPGVHSCIRYSLESTTADQFAKYAALYDVDDPGVPSSEGWQRESEKGDWATKIRPHATNRTHTMLNRIADSGDETARWRPTSSSCAPTSPPTLRTISTTCTTPSTSPACVRSTESWGASVPRRNHQRGRLPRSTSPFTRSKARRCWNRTPGRPQPRTNGPPRSAPSASA